MPRNNFEKALTDDQRALDLRKLNDALNSRSNNLHGSDQLASAKLAEAILRAQRGE